MKGGRHCSRTLPLMPTASPRCAAAGTMVMTSTMMTRPGTSAERSARASPRTRTHRQLGRWRAECATAAASSGTSRDTRSTGRIRSRWRRAAAAVGDLENRYHSDAQCRHTRRAESFGLPWILSHSDTRERGHAFTRVHAPPPSPHVHGHRHAARSSAQRISWAYDRSPGYPWPPVRGSRLWHARVVLHPVCTAAGRPAASVLQSSARREPPAHASTAFFEFVAYSSDDSNFARGTNLVIKSVGLASSRTCPISHSPARTRCRKVM